MEHRKGHWIPFRLIREHSKVLSRALGINFREWYKNGVNEYKNKKPFSKEDRDRYLSEITYWKNLMEELGLKEGEIIKFSVNK